MRRDNPVSDSMLAIFHLGKDQQRSATAGELADILCTRVPNGFSIRLAGQPVRHAGVFVCAFLPIPEGAADLPFDLA
jgi:hypothetical protein